MDTLVDPASIGSDCNRPASDRPRRADSSDTLHPHPSVPNPAFPKDHAPALCGVPLFALDPRWSFHESDPILPRVVVRETISFCRLAITSGVVLPDDRLPVGVLELPWRVMLALGLDEDQLMDYENGKIHQIRVRTGDRDSAPYAHPETCKRFEQDVVLRCFSNKGIGITMDPAPPPESP